MQSLTPNVQAIGQILRTALEKNWIRAEDTAVIFYDLDCLIHRFNHLNKSFPPGTLHGLAIKANPLAGILSLLSKESPSAGVEAASMGEVYLALAAGFTPYRIVYDSPVKTREEIEFALSKGVHLNVDNLDELERVGGFLQNPHPDRVSPPRQGGATLSGWGSSSIGLRINPQVGVGTIAESSVAGAYSKFGVPIRYRQKEIIQAFLSYPWLSGVHLHVGSQGCEMDLLVEGIGILYDMVCEVNPKRISMGVAPISIFDIGGGLPISYHSTVSPPSMEDYVARIRRRAPMLFESFRLITEFGRWIFTNPGWTVSRVEYVKHDPEVNTAMLHVGADLFVRECLNPVDWHHEYSVFDCHGNYKSGKDQTPWNLAGPLCFSGDIIAKGVTLPIVEEGDYLVIHDTGGYTFSMWSRYNSRQTPRILGYQNSSIEILKERETLEQLASFWR